MVLTYDVGSIPFSGDFDKFTKVLRIHPLLELLSHKSYASDRSYFEDKVIESFVDKVEAGIATPNYPQFRDMNEMFLNCIDGVAKTSDGYKVVDRMSMQKEKSIIPEVAVIRENEREIYERVGRSFTVKICITGPYTLTSLFKDRGSHLFIELGRIIRKFVEKNVFNKKFSKVSLIAVDEPVFGLIDDSLLDYGQDGREALLKAWEIIFHEIKSRDIQSIIHLHNTTNDLFWHVNSLDIVESHVDDPLYSSSKTGKYLEKLDKFLKASICITDFTTLIKKTEAFNGVIDEMKINQRIADTWTGITKGKVDPEIFLESTSVIFDRLRSIIRLYGERVSFAGPECGLRSFPKYDSAMECLRRVAEATQQLNLYK